MANTPIQTSSQFPTFQWVFSWRVIRVCLFVLACFFTLLALFYAEENWRGVRAERAYRRELETKGARLDPTAFIPPAVPDEQNFATTPFFAPLFDFNPRPLHPGQAAWRDTNAWQRTMDFAKGVREISVGGNWQIGKRTDLSAWQDESEKARKRSSRETNSVMPAAASSTQGAGWVLTALKDYEPALDELRDASRRPHSRFNLQYDVDNPAEMLLPHLSVIKRVCETLKLRAAAELQLGQIDPAASDVNLMLYLTDSLKGEPILISQLVRIACLNLTVQIIWEGLVEHKWADAQLREWQTRLRQFDFITDLRLALEAERAWGDRIIDWASSSQGANRIVELADPPGGPDPSQQAAIWMVRIWPRGWFDLEKLNYNRIFEELILTGFDSQTRRIHPRVSAENAKRLEKSLESSSGLIPKHQIFTRLLVPAMTRVQQKFGLAQTSVDQAIVACALERYRLAIGQFPEKLDSLVPRFIENLPNDVIPGEPLKYRRTPDGQFLLYSVGWNEKDDGGTIVTSKESRGGAPDFAQGDWVWQFPAAH